MSTEAPIANDTSTAATPAPTAEATPSAAQLAKQSLGKFRANFNPAHTVANLLRKSGTLADKLPTPGEVARNAATKLDAIDPKAYEKRVAELKALEEKLEAKFAAGSGK